MAKTTERRAAKEFYMQFKEQKDIASLLNVSEKTVTEWVTKYGWKSEREARINGSRNQINALKDVISQLTEQRQELFVLAKAAKRDGDKEESLALSKQATSIADEISKYNKTLENFDERNRISLGVYLEVMDDIFNNIHKREPKLFAQLIEFQEQHLSHVSSKYN